MLIFSLEPGSALAEGVAAALDTTLAPHEERRFADGECKLRPLVDPRGSDVYVVMGLHGGPVDSPWDKLGRLLMFIAALKDHGAARVTAVVPYLAFARKDQQTKPFDPVTLRTVAQLFDAVGTGQVFVLEVHNVSAFQNAFRCPTVHLPGHAALAAVAHEAALDAGGEAHLAVASPDPGGVKRALLWREALEAQLARPVGFAMIDKRRSAGVVSGGRLVAGEVDAATVLLFDDLIASGDTMRRAADALRRAGARQVIACAAHGLFTDRAAELLADEALARVVVTDSVPAFRLPPEALLRRKLQVVSAVPLIADAIRSSHASWWT
ncbi:MAG: ribose-phosphate pyrophosphokinase [Rhizobacter sp.]|nr:ribose-phosphate pyrophosphokinase [Rhizobacter sp.]